jgi:riboflavin transporter FmnP
LTGNPIDNNSLKESPSRITGTQSIAVVAVFSAIAIGLHTIPLRLPFLPLPFLWYEFWEIPIVAAFLLYGIRVGLSVSAINTLSLLYIFPGDSPAGPFYNLVAILSMIMPALLVYQAIGKRLSGKLVLALFLIVGISFRVIVMTIFNSIMLPLPPPLGFETPIDRLYGMLPLLAVFNGSIAAYIIPLSQLVTTAVSRTTQTPAKYGWWIEQRIG